MRGKIKISVTLFLIVAITLTVFSEVVYSKNEKYVIVEVYDIKAFSVKKREMVMSVEKADKLKHILTELYDATSDRDIKSIEGLESKIIGLVWILSNPHLDFSYDKNDASNISNYLCYFQAIGEGKVILPVIYWLEEKISEKLENASSFAEGLAIIIATALVYLPLILAAYLFPLKIFAPVMEVDMNSGRMRTVGTEGSKVINIDSLMGVEVKGFTGVVINIPLEQGFFFFVSGLALSVTETEP